jgi:hypothetical protein
VGYVVTERHNVTVLVGPVAELVGTTVIDPSGSSADTTSGDIATRGTVRQSPSSAS